MEISTTDIKAIAKSIRKQLKDAGQPALTHTLVLESISSALGFKNWESLESKLDAESKKGKSSSTPSSTTSVYAYHFNGGNQDGKVKLFNGTNLVEIRGVMDLMPVCDKIEYSEVSSEGSELAHEIQERVEIFDGISPFLGEDGKQLYADANWNYVSEDYLVRAPIELGEDPDEFPIRRYLVREYWLEIAKATNILEFMALPAKDRVVFVEAAFKKIRFALTTPERLCLDENHVFDEMLLVDWFGIACRADNPDGDFMSGRMFETYGHDHTYVLSVNAKDPGRVWTWVDCDGENVVVSGYHYVNRIGYFISEKALPDNVSSVDFADEDYEPDTEDFSDEDSDEDSDE